MFCNKQHNAENCIVIKNYKKTIDCPSLTKNANNHNHSNSKLKLAHLNVRSLKNRDNLIQLRELNGEHQYDILTISESWLNSTVKNSEVEIEGYRLLRLDRLGKRGGGVCVFTRNSLKTKIIKDISVISSMGFHQLWILIQHKKMKSIVLCVAYRPPDCPVSCFVDDFMDNYSYALTLKKDIFVVGDLNCNLLKSGPESDALNELCSSLNLFQLIKEPTRVTLQSSSLIDVILTSNTSLVVESGVEKTHISDHFLVYSILKLKLPKKLPDYMVIRSFKNYSSEAFKNDLEQLIWQENPIDQGVNQRLDNFNQKFLSVLDMHAPIKTVKIKRRLCPFVDQEIVQLMKKRNALHKLARQTLQALDWDRYRSCRNQIKRKLRESERKFVYKRINDKNSNNNSLWKTVRECIPRNEKTRLTYSGNVVEVANKFNEYFSSVGAKAAEESKALITSYGLTSTHPEIPHKFRAEIDKFHFHSVSCDVIRKIVCSFPSNKSPGPDKVSVKVIKDALPYILQPLTDIVNCSLRESLFPSAWKLSEVIPLLKKGDHEIAKNNRPISLLLAASKICERVVLEQFTAYVEQKKCLSVHQSGNRKLHSTETLNLFISDKILKSMDDKEVVAVILLDLSKAFDSIDHVLLLKKLQVLGVSDDALCWFKSYLTGRQQVVRIGSTVSETRTHQSWRSAGLNSRSHVIQHIY
ncbi:Hypothetical predicted protein [Paramuricea clavata]|uniref:Uncharacterized protein n=1 Tax=Paramuricea clavata TaxID=317549 RepID=A0A6S7HJZ9_PARCT|nr:Hypothetical predicted protein [Paramuricea clavata]